MTRWLRVEPVDVLTTEDCVLVLYERRLVQLGLLAGAVLEWCEAPRTAPELACLLEDAFGAPEGDVLQETQSVITELVDQDILTSAPKGRQ